MKRLFLSTLTAAMLPAAILVAGCLPNKAPQTDDPADTTASGCGPATAEGYCGVLFGMSADEAREAYPGGLVGGAEDDPYGNSSCYYLNVAPDSYEIGFMVVDGIVMRLDVRAPGVATAAGAMAGMTVDEVLALYPDAELMPNKYTEEDDIHVDLGGEAKAIFEQAFGEGTIGRYRIGLAPPVDYVEGCA